MWLGNRVDCLLCAILMIATPAFFFLGFAQGAARLWVLGFVSPIVFSLPSFGNVGLCAVYFGHVPLSALRGSLLPSGLITSFAVAYMRLLSYLSNSLEPPI